jgi:hypothetical protein
MASPQALAESEYKRQSAMLKVESIGHLKPGWHKLLDARIKFLQELMTQNPSNAVGCSFAIQELRRLIADTNQSDPDE